MASKSDADDLGFNSKGHIDVLCMYTKDASCDFHVGKFKRRKVGDYDVLIDMKFCGVCHSDLHHAANHNHKFKETPYRCVPGHELAGVCKAVGPKVTKIQVGDHVGVGCMVDSCLDCAQCKQGEEQKCTKGNVGTYGATQKYGRAAICPDAPEQHTLGGYTSQMVCDERFVIRVPKSYPLKFAGPVMCAGITMYDPLRAHKVGKGSRVGVIGLGGLGQMGLKLAKALGCHVTAISRKASKRDFAKSCGADSFIVSSSDDDLASGKGSLDLILNTVPVYHNYDIFFPLLAPGGKQVIFGLHKGIAAGLILSNLSKHTRLTYSGIGGIRATQEVIDLCDRHKIYPEVEVRPVSDLNKIFAALEDNKTGKRFVLDIENTLSEAAEAACVDPPPALSDTESMSVVGGLCEACRLIWCCKAKIWCCFC
eukprot:g3101.t1